MNDTDPRMIMAHDRELLRKAGCKCQKIILTWNKKQDRVECATCHIVAKE